MKEGSFKNVSHHFTIFLDQLSSIRCMSAEHQSLRYNLSSYTIIKIRLRKERKMIKKNQVMINASKAQARNA